MYESGMQGKIGNEIGGERVGQPGREGREGGFGRRVGLEHILKFSINNWERRNFTNCTRDEHRKEIYQ
jgi:hypothetical protein